MTIGRGQWLYETHSRYAASRNARAGHFQSELQSSSVRAGHSTIDAHSSGARAGTP